MAVQAQQHAFHHDLHSYRALEDGTTGASLFLDERGGCAPAVAGIVNTAVLSDLTCNDHSYNYAFAPRKRARVAAEAPGFVVELEQPRGVRTPAAPQGFVPVGDMLSRVAGSGAASTSGRIGNAAGVPRLFHPGMEIDALVRAETERMRACLEEARRRHVRTLVAAAERATAGRLRAAEAALELARGRTAELEERLRQTIAEGQAWIGVARSHEAVAAGLRAALDQLLIQSPSRAAQSGRECDDAQSCCFETTPARAGDDAVAASKASAACCCRACGEGAACVLLLPCRHLCLCLVCEGAVDTCPVCAAAKNASFHVLLS